MFDLLRITYWLILAGVVAFIGFQLTDQHFYACDKTQMLGKLLVCDVKP